MQINFNIDEDDALVLIQALTFAANEINNKATKQQLLQAIQEIRSDAAMDKLLYQYTCQLLDPYTTAVILRNSNLRQGLGINTTWMKNYLHVGCNNILKKVLQAYRPDASTTPITDVEAKRCVVVQDIIDLIKSRYESAQ